MITKDSSTSMIYSTTKKTASKKKSSNTKKTVTQKIIKNNPVIKKRTTTRSTKKGKNPSDIIQKLGLTEGVVYNQEERQNMVSIAAYYLAEKRNFSDGGEYEDWLQAEQEIDNLLLTDN